MMSSPLPAYRAFISYSHKDGGFARWLHRKLESYRLPKLLQSATAGIDNRHPLRPVFLDLEERVLAASLSDNMVQALNAFAALIVIYSPAAASRWVNEEILHFHRNFTEQPAG